MAIRRAGLGAPAADTSSEPAGGSVFGRANAPKALKSVTTSCHTVTWFARN
jgi:hypothetical protein